MPDIYFRTELCETKMSFDDKNYYDNIVKSNLRNKMFIIYNNKFTV